LMLWMLFWLWHIATVYGFSSVLMGNIVAMIFCCML
jgi:hypothetical protein